MCGIFGVINTNNTRVRQEELENGLKLLHHRGPDHQGFFIENNLGLAANRLAIIDLHERSNQPFQQDEFTLLFNGAVYNYKELRTELQSKGHQFNTDGDTEVVLKSYIEWGSACLDKFNGMWAIAIYDKVKQNLFMARDRFGIKPFYYFKSVQQFSFASEIKAFTKLSTWVPKWNAEVLSNYLAFGMQDYDEKTMFQNVYHLPAAHFMSYDLKSHNSKIERYYSLPNRQKPIDIDEAKVEFRKLFADAVALRFRSDVKIGSCLSGGLDSSSILAMAAGQNLTTKTYTSISAVYDIPEIDESKYIDAIVNKTQVQNKKIQPSWDQFTVSIDNLIWTQDEPFSSASVFAQNEVFRTAKSFGGCTVMLDGQGADEILAGYDNFYLPYWKFIKQNEPQNLLREYIGFVRHYSNNYQNLWHRFTQSKKKTSENPSWLLLESNRISPYSVNSIADQSRKLLGEMGLQALLHYEDRNSMAHSIESRLPFLDFRLVEFCLSLPEGFKIYKGKRKYLLREALKIQLPKEIYSRTKKLGFETPQNQWMAKHQKFVNTEIQEVLSKLKMIINPKQVPYENDKNLQWRLMMINRWINVFGIKQ